MIGVPLIWFKGQSNLITNSTIWLVVLGFLLLRKDTIAIFHCDGSLTVLEGTDHYHHGVEHGSMQVNVVLE